jgi:hypothetical protein
MWHDHRVHWMSPKRPAPIDSLGTVVEWKVPFSVDGVTTTMTGTLFLREKASVLWWLAGFAALLCAVALSVRRRKEFFAVTFLMSVVGVVVGAIQFVGLPDGARITPLILMFSAGASVVAHDPVAGEVAGMVFADLLKSGDLLIAPDALESARDADALVLVTEWPQYRAISPSQLKSVMRGHLVLDGRNTLEGESFKQLGFSYAGIGQR